MHETLVRLSLPRVTIHNSYDTTRSQNPVGFPQKALGALHRHLMDKVGSSHHILGLVFQWHGLSIGMDVACGCCWCCGLCLPAAEACSGLSGFLHTDTQANMASPVASVKAALLADPTGIAGFAWLQTW